MPLPQEVYSFSSLSMTCVNFAVRYRNLDTHYPAEEDLTWDLDPYAEDGLEHQPVWASTTSINQDFWATDEICSGLCNGLTIMRNIHLHGGLSNPSDKTLQGTFSNLMKWQATHSSCGNQPKERHPEARGREIQESPWLKTYTPALHEGLMWLEEEDQIGPCWWTISPSHDSNKLFFVKFK